MTGTVITDLRRHGAVDPGRVLRGPLRGVGLRRLAPGHRAEVAADGVEHTLYVVAGSGTASAPDTTVPLVVGTALALTHGSATVLTAGTRGLEFFHAVLTGPPPGPGDPEGGEPA